MITYISAFIFYTLAMMGVLFVGFIIYKKTFLMDKTNPKGNIKIVDSLAIGPKKMLFTVEINNEKFLIASGETHTTFLAKLNAQESPINKVNDSKIENSIEQDDYINEYQASYQNPYQSQIQRQFKNLYSRDSKTPSPFQKALNQNSKREAIKKLLRDLNEATSMNEGNY